MHACVRVALVLMAVFASFGFTGCGPMNDLKDAVSRWFDIGKSPGGRGLFADELPDAPPMSAREKTMKRKASKASKKNKPASKVQRRQTAEKKLPTSDATEGPKPQAEPQSVPSQPTPSRLRTLWPEAPPAGTFSR
jgi:hypothetical protein